jgi:hypothetical protein
VEFGPEDAVAAAERLIRPTGGGLPMLAESAATSSTTDAGSALEPHDEQPLEPLQPTPSHHRVVAIALLLVFVVPFLATIARTIVR